LEQLSLFGIPQIILGDYHRAIKKGDWESLERIILSLDEPGNRPSGWQKKKLFWEKELVRIRENEDRSPTEMASYWEKLLLDFKDVELKPEFDDLQGYWFARLTDKLKDKDFDYLTENIHPSYCLLTMGRYQEGGHKALRYLNEKGENAQLRTYQSFCFDKMKRKREALTSLTFALFFDPLSVDIAFVFSNEIKNVYEVLKMRDADSRLVRAKWPFECWMERLVDIPLEEELADRITALYHGYFLTEDAQTEFDSQIYFNHLLYIAEISRQKTHIVASELLDIRNRMKDINGKAFKKYMESIL
jgi:hypothetical protein